MENFSVLIPKRNCQSAVSVWYVLPGFGQVERMSLIMASFFFSAEMNDKTLFPREKLRTLEIFTAPASSYQHIRVQMWSLYLIYVDAPE